MAERSSENEERFDQIVHQYYRAVEAGESDDPEAFIRQHSEYESQLRSFFADLHALDDLPGVGAMDRTIDQSGSRKSHAMIPNIASGHRITYVGQYRLLEEIARGGMGVVFKVRHEKLKRIVALKMILSGPLASSTEIDRFRREARAAARLQHPNIVSVHEIGQHDGHYFFTMDYVESVSLSECLREGSLSPRESARLVETIARAMHYAHGEGVLHRDLKPANILIDKSRQPHITDFGLAKAQSDVDHETLQEMTRTGQILGTPSYMSPEQASAKQDLVGPASDIYSLGAVLYACLTGRAPFVTDSPVDTLLQVKEKEPVSPRDLNPSIPRDLETICLKCLSKEPHKRYGAAHLLADDLGRFLEGRPVVARPVGALSRLLRFARRNQAIASLVLLSALLLTTGTVVSTLFAIEANARAEAESKERRRADETVELLRAANAETNRALASESQALADMEAERDEAKRQTRRAETLLYATHLNAAKANLSAGRIDEARENLDRCRSDLRGWEYDFLSAVGTDHQNALEQQRENLNLSGRLLTSKIEEISSAVLSPNASRAVIIGYLGAEAFKTKSPIINITNGDIEGQLTGLDSCLTAAAWSKDGSLITTGAEDGSISLWNAMTCQQMMELTAHESMITTMEFSPDGRSLVTGSGDTRMPPNPDATGELIVYNVDTGKVRWRLQGHPGALTCSAFSPDGRWIASGGFGDGFADPGDLRVWNAATGDLAFSMEGPPSAVLSVAFSPDSTQLAVAGGLSPGEKEVLLVDVETGQTVLTLPDHRESIISVVFSPDGNRIATLGGLHAPDTQHHVKLWDSATGVELLQLELDLKQMFWRTNNPGMLGIGRANDRATLVELSAEQQRVLPQLIIRRGLASAATSLAFAQDGQQIVSGSVYENVHVWDVKTGNEVGIVTRHSKPIDSISVSRDGSRIASTSGDGLKIWDRKLQREILSLETLAHDAGYASVACSPDGQQIAVGDYRGDAWVWTLSEDSHHELSSLKGHKGLVRSIVFSSDGTRVATASDDKTARVWAAETGDQLALFDGHQRVVTCVAFSPDGTQVVSGSFDKTLKIWNAHDAENVTSLEGHTASVLCVAFSPDGKRIASGASDNEVKIWDSESGDILTTLSGHEFYVRSVAFSPDGALLASAAGAQDMTIRVWPTPLSR